MFVPGRPPFVIRLVLVGLAIGATAAVARAAADASLSREHADQLVRKISVIALHGLSTQPESRKTTITEQEVNSYLAFHARKQLPAGVLDPTVTIMPAGRLTGRAIVDLDAVRKAREAAGQTAPMLMTGRLPVQAAGVLKTGNGMGRFELQQAWIGGIPIPKTLLEQIVAYYTRTPDMPDGIDLDAPFELPSAIREIRTSQGAAIIIQ
ncbi:MAG TPA: hypothetical protein VNK41_01220 [Vicinamibacterales bacterium]|nr:hypothetical protein [Vicinamibacterales bacterium]